jgi:hypothetical protein
MTRFWPVALAVLMVWVLQSGPAAAAKPPMDQAGFTAYVATELAKAVPSGQVPIAGPLTIHVGDTPSGGLSSISTFCPRRACGQDGPKRDKDAPLERSDLRVVVRSASYLAQARQTAAGNDVVAALLAGDLWLLGAVDRPSAIEVLTTRSLALLI